MTPALRLIGVGLTRDGRDLLDGIDWEVGPGDRWVVLGPNGSGKTSLVRVASFQTHPSRGDVEVLGQRLGRVNIWDLRNRIGLASSALADQLRPQLTASDVVVTQLHGALEPWWHTYSDDDRAQAQRCLDRMGVGAYADREIGTLSSGERQRVLLARTLMGDPGVVLLDEPSANLDLGGREGLVQSLSDLAADPSAPPIVFVTHHVEEIPPGFTSLLLLREGRIEASGPLAETLTESALSELFGVKLRLRLDDGRYSAIAIE
ncbi:MAG TPA: ATP-binding cassette domain-containing protein [Acidimicrobiales bacterium]|nr:ATP-binding cassette domain-containing protein [Acidimicrobiales bacterium]